MSDGFTVKDSGRRIEYASGMVRDVQDGKTNYLLVRDGPMHRRDAEHLTRGASKYGERNWPLACSEAELQRFRASAARHFEQWLDGDRDEDHAAATRFNINAAEYVEDVLRGDERALVLLDETRQLEAKRQGFDSWADLEASVCSDLSRAPCEERDCVDCG